MTRLALRLLVVALIGWLACFGVLAVVGTWTPFALLGVSLAAVAVQSRAVSWGLLRPSPRVVALGAIGGTSMVLLTHLAYVTVVKGAPSVGGATRELLTLLNVAGFSPGARALLITVIASCEELLFRGLLPGPALQRATGLRGWPGRDELKRIVVFTVAYALTTAPLGSPLLMLCALVCGGVWASMRVATGSLVVPILAHVIWDLGVLLVWPLATS